MQGSDKSKPASAPPAMNVTRTIEEVARSNSEHQPVTIAQQSSIARDASHSTSPSSSHDTPQFNNDSNTEERGGNSSHAAMHSVDWLLVVLCLADVVSFNSAIGFARSGCWFCWIYLWVLAGFWSLLLLD